MDIYVECGCCGHYHREEFTGDCRQDNERFTIMDLEEMGIPYDNIKELEA